MNCPNCGKETKGLKLNGKLFCSFCGEVIKDSAEILEDSYSKLGAPKRAKTSRSEAKIINQDNQEQKAKAPTKAESEAEPGKIKEEPAPRKVNPLRDKSIRKHERPRADRRFDLLPDEPDPINEPELESPHEMLVSKPSAESTGSDFSLLSKEERKDLSSKKKKRQEFLTNYFRHTSGVGQQKKKKRKSQRKKPSKWLVISSVFLLVLLIFAGLVYYVNRFAMNESRIRQNIESKAAFAYSKPAAVPTGYRLSYQSRADKNFIEYYYLFQGEAERFISLQVEPTEVKPSEVLDKLLGDMAVSFSQTNEGGLEFWQTSDNKIYVIEGGLLYTFQSSKEVFGDDLLSFAKETLF